MAVSTGTPEYNALTATVREWDRRLRVQQTVAWSARAFMPGLALAVIVGLISRVNGLLDNTGVALIGGVGILVGIGVLLAFVWMRDRSPVDSARRFDVTFDLKERVSTALELMEGRIRADESLTVLQLDDAAERAKTVSAHDGLPLQIRTGEWRVVALLALIFAALVLIPNPLDAANTDDPARDAVVDDAIAQIEDAIEQVATDPSLDEAARQDLLEELEVNLATLQDEDITIDEALATLGDVESLLSQQADQLREQIAQDAQALEDAAQALEGDSEEGEGEGEEGSGEGEEGEQSFQESLDNLSGSIDEMSEGERQAAAERVDEAAAMLSDAQEQTSASLEDAADALENGDIDAAQDALEQAQDSLEAEQQQQEQQEQSAQNLEQSAQQMQQQQQDGQEGQQSQQESQQSDSQGQQSQQQEGSSDESEDGSQQSENANSEGNQSGGQPQQGQQENAQDSEGQGASEASQVGSEAGNLSDDTSGFQNDGQNAPQQGEEGLADQRDDYESVFAPRSLESETGETEINLEPDMGDAPLREGDFTDNPTGDSVVPYNEVFNSYENAANEALDQGYIPLSLRDVVRDYFTSLAPRGASDDN